MTEILDSGYAWFATHWQNLAVSVIAICVIYVIYKLLSKEINKLKTQEKMDEPIAYNLNRLFKWVAIIVIIGILVTQFVIDLSPVFGFLALAGGTIIGFASMNTIGNAIAGIIVLTSKPFQIGDRIIFNEEIADVIAIDLIYTRMKTLDNVLISVPNQQLLTTKIDNYGKKTTVRRSCSITVGYDMPSEEIEKILLQIPKQVEGVLKEPKPYVFVTDLQNFSVEYTLYVFINQIKKLPLIESNLKRTTVEVCKKNGIDLTTPNLIQNVGQKTTQNKTE
ncbi:MAG: mechanosensitive ion channel family protein [Candidatus Bathyarchaeota archaeon]|nr:mechanosensitive ion channel family protein [Candidatus Bathyarchaeota archaeon]